MAVEIFTNLATTTVSSGGTTAPAPGTTEVWAVTSSASFPAAASGVSQFHIQEDDSVKQSEIILVTNVSGTSWNVTRGVEGTTPVAHTAGFTIIQTVTAGFLNTVRTSTVALTAADVGAGTFTGAFTFANGVVANWNAGNYTTPVGSVVGTAFGSPSVAMTQFNQVVALGITATAHAQSRALSLFDARTTSHQPTLAVFSPNENNMVGFSWEGGNTQAVLKVTSGADAGINADTVNYLMTDIATTTLFLNQPTRVTNTDGSRVLLTVRGAGAGQTGDYQRWQDSANVVKAKIDSGGYLYNLGVADVAATGAWTQFNPAGTDTGSQVITTRAAANVGLIVRGVASQSGDLQRWQNSTPTTLTKIDQTGAIFTTLEPTISKSAPALTLTDSTRTSRVGVATVAGDIGSGSQVGDLVLASSAGRTYTSGVFAALGAINTSAGFTGVTIGLTGTTGATTASRFVGATASGSPVSGTFQAGDVVTTRDGHVWIATTTSTWAEVGANLSSLTVTGNVNLGNKSLWNGQRTLPGPSNTVDLGTFSSTNGAFQINLMMTVDVSGFAVTKSYELDVTASVGSASTWYKVLPQDSTQNSGAGTDFTLEVNRNATTNAYTFRIRQIGSTGGTLSWQAEGYGTTGLAFSSSINVTSVPAVVSTIWGPTPLFMGPSKVGILTDSPAFELDVAGAVNTTGGLYVLGRQAVTSSNGTANKLTVLPNATPPSSPSTGDLWIVSDITAPSTPLAPLGYVAGNSSTAATTPLSASLGTETAVASTATFTPVTGRRYRLSMSARASAGVANQLVALRLNSSSGSTRLMDATALLSVVGGNGQVTITQTRTIAAGDTGFPAGTSCTFTLVATQTAGATTTVASIVANATGALTNFIIEDIGV